MANVTKRGMALCLLILLIGMNVSTIQAARGVPGSPEFGFGAVLYPDGTEVQNALAMSADLGLDWLAVPISWAALQKDASIAPRWEALDPIVRFAAEHKISVLASVAQAPSWAQTSLGPEASRTAQFVQALLDHYPTIAAVELFPSANTQQGWGGVVNAQAYNQVYQTVARQIQHAHPETILVAAGLRPVAKPAPAGDMDDLQFLQELYQQGAASSMRVISIQFGDVSGDPLDFPTSREPRVMRHYEEVRRVMLENKHQIASIWITRFGPPSGTITSSDTAYHDLNAQGNWLGQVYLQTRSQLYIGVVIGQSLNLSGKGATAGIPGLLLQNGNKHPFYSVLREMISLNKTGNVTVLPGKLKEGNLAKKRP